MDRGIGVGCGSFGIEFAIVAVLMFAGFVLHNMNSHMEFNKTGKLFT